MGVGWRIFTERVREYVPGGGVAVTSNARNKSMMKTATDFSHEVRKCERAIKDAQAANAVLLGTTKAVMTLALPQTYDGTNSGAGSATAGIHIVGGPNFNAESISRLTNESGHKLETEVLAPLQRWQDVFAQLTNRYKEVELTRLELDSRRRTVTDLSNRVSAMRARLGQGGNHSKQEQKLDATIRTLSHKEAKLKVTSQNFEQQETLLARDLAALITDGQYLKHYVAAALRLQGGALLGGADAFGELNAAAPAGPPQQQQQLAASTSMSAGGSAGGGGGGFGSGQGAPAPIDIPAGATSTATSASTSALSHNPYTPTGGGGSMSNGGAGMTSLALPPEQPVNTKRFSVPPADVPGQERLGGSGGSGGAPLGAEGMPLARFPVAPMAQQANDNPYTASGVERGYTYT